jgi:opacity protein-like surface antigen
VKTLLIRLGLATVCVLLVAGGSSVHAEDVEKKWRLGFNLGMSDSQGEIRSDAANILTVTDERDIQVRFFEDPRNDDAQGLKLQIDSAPRVTLSAQYAITKIFIVEMSAGYQRGDVGNIELQAEFALDPREVDQRFKFRCAGCSANELAPPLPAISAGEIEMVPLMVTALARFRPRASFNPYIGAGIGYIITGFEPSSELDSLSKNMDSSIGRFTQLQTFPNRFNPVGTEGDLGPVNVEVPDTFEWHLMGGVEYTFKRKWATYLDINWAFTSQAMTLTFDPPSPSVGISVPNKRVFVTDPEATATYGAIEILEGGIVDGGSLQPIDPNAPSEICEVTPSACVFDGSKPDGVPDPGIYYIKSGTLDYENVTLAIGVRYTF